MNANAQRTGRGVAVVLAVIELAVLAWIILYWASTYWSWDPQHHGERPDYYLTRALIVPSFALVATVVASIRRVRAVAISQAVMFIALCGIMLCFKDAGERAYEDSYRDACRAGVICDGDSPTAR
ncbi:DUF6234 family protein [Streptomyces sp. NPDC050636]|uniref:DUF6234 family protein n=1 Tax=Streptomyces sp. NPDC050636 TaxID=3154510 RepID=UPI003425B396